MSDEMKGFAIFAVVFLATGFVAGVFVGGISARDLTICRYEMRAAVTASDTLRIARKFDCSITPTPN